MNTFLDAVAADLYTRYREKISGLCLVFPNRRSRLFFAQSLSKLIDKPLWQPRYNSIEEVVCRASGGQQPSEPLALLLELYDVYCAVRQTDEPFDRFYFWGDVMLHDFDLIDKYRIDARQLFRNLKAQKDLEGDLSFLTEEQIAHIRKFWSSFSPEKSELQDRFFSIWNVLPGIYTQFNQRLQEKGMAYEGMLYRNIDTDNLREEQFVFIGFNALNECEKLLFRQLQKQGKAEFYWDCDAYYLHNPQQEAGAFLRQNVRDFPSPLFDKDFSPFAGEKEIRVVTAPSDVIQAKLTPQLLTDMGATADHRTAVVLADETLLIPTLHALPAAADSINVTMGYPLRQTPVYTLLDLYLRLHLKTKQNGAKTRFYHRDVLPLLYHPCIKTMAKEKALCHASDIAQKNKVYVSPGEFNDDALLQAIFTPVERYGQLVAQMQYLLEALSRTASSGNSKKLICTYAHHCAKLLNRLKKSADESHITLSLPVFAGLLRKLLRSESVPFTGEPLAGLQVLGLLETRNLDFEHVILLSCNEGVLPKHANAPSFIPYNLRRGFGLPTAEQHEAVYAYYFYRLLQRAKKITLVYNSKVDDTHTGEASRYLLQLAMETKRPIEQFNVSFSMSHETAAPIVVEKDEKVMQELLRYCREESDPPYLSPSAINMYVACSLRFYFRHVAHLKPRDEVAEDVDGRLLGNVLHHAMEALYEPFRNKTLHADDLKTLSAQLPLLTKAIDAALADAYYHAKRLPEEVFDDGKMMLLRDVALKYIRQILHYDAAQAPFTIEDTELRVVKRLDIPQRPHIGGVIDRLDRQGDTWHIIDYKTGATKNKFKSVEGLFSDDPAQHNPAILQVMLYSVLLKWQHPDREISPKLYFMREIYNSDADFRIIDTDISPYVAPFTEALNNTLSQLFNAAIPFVQTAHPDVCEYCDYRKICGR
ncbi:MAG: PD-(D/E)XK nuclease family protein, partial [Prevotellaceae bacterium]|nr:PD-(D/E)XK nuclease family protein [Prevotellaceae bacterium]